MNILLLDTSVVSLLHPRKKGTSLALQYEQVLNGDVWAVSFQTVAELWAWPFCNPNWPKQQIEDFPKFLQKFLVIPYEPELAKACGFVVAYSQKRGLTLAWGDAWVVATAVYCNLPLVTHDRDQIQVAFPGLQIISFLE